MTKLKSMLLVTTGIIIGASAISVLNAQGNAPYFEVAAINVTDQAGYEASGVDKVRDAIKAGGGKLIAGGYNKARSRVCTTGWCRDIFPAFGKCSSPGSCGEGHRISKPRRDLPRLAVAT